MEVEFELKVVGFIVRASDQSYKVGTLLKLSGPNIGQQPCINRDVGQFLRFTLAVSTATPRVNAILNSP
jgi:hypothetical protein